MVERIPPVEVIPKRKVVKRNPRKDFKLYDYIDKKVAIALILLLLFLVTVIGFASLSSQSDATVDEHLTPTNEKQDTQSTQIDAALTPTEELISNMVPMVMLVAVIGMGLSVLIQIARIFNDR